MSRFKQNHPDIAPRLSPDEYQGSASAPPEGVPLPMSDTLVEVENGHGASKNPVTVAGKTAKKFVDLMLTGETVQMAAKRLHATVGTLIADPAFMAQVQGLVVQGYLPAEVRKMMIRGGLNQAFARGINSDDPDLRKDALNAAKQIAEDPEVGLKHAGPAIEIDLGALADIFNKAEQ